MDEEENSGAWPNEWPDSLELLEHRSAQIERARTRLSKSNANTTGENVGMVGYA